jgi:hypothetical protein
VQSTLPGTEHVEEISLSPSNLHLRRRDNTRAGVRSRPNFPAFISLWYYRYK